MSVWNQAYEDFRRPYYEEEKKAKKDYDGDGKVESGSKEHAGAVHNAIQRAKGGKADGQDTRKEEAVAEGSMKQARKNVGASTCWDGYKAKGTKMKNGRQVPNCVKEEDLEEGIRDKDPEKGTEERKARLEKKRGMKMDDHPQYKKEEAESLEEKKRGLYANIHAKRARGEAPAKPGDEDYPAKDAFKKAAKTAKKEHYDWRADFDFVIEKKSEDCGCDHTPKKGVKNKVTVMPEVKTEETELQEGPYIITGPDITGNTPAYRNFKAGMKSKVTGKPMYKLGPGVKLPEEVELDENRRAARSAGGYKDDSKKQPDPSKDGFTGVGNMSIDQIRKMSARIDKKNKSKKEEVEFAGNYEGPLYAPHPDIKKDQELDEKFSTQYKDKKKMGQSSQRKSLGRGSSIKDGAKPSGYESKKEFRTQEMRNMKEDLAGAVDSVTKRAQGALEKIGVKINRKPRPTATPSAQTQNTMRQNSMSNEEAVSEGKKKKDDSYLETNMKKRHANNEKARKDMEKMGTKMKNPHFEETLLDKVVKTYVSEEDYDRMKDRRMERGGVGGNTNYKNPPKNNTNKFGKGKTAMQKELEKKHGKGKSAMDIVRAEIQKKHGKGALIDTKKKKDK
tara:strand:+ start:4813 stop:6663 length:1851 start_codon:yes stop_codon:yes gene_type:complete